MCHFDDVIIFAKTFEERVLRLDKVLACLSTATFDSELPKVAFWRSADDYSWPFG